MDRIVVFRNNYRRLESSRLRQLQRDPFVHTFIGIESALR